MYSNASSSQLEAWSDCISVLRSTLEKTVAAFRAAGTWGVIFEYELPRERGRRPDVVILGGSKVLVLEFKQHSRALQEHIDQVAAYARDLRNYQAACHDKEVIPVLIPTGYKGNRASSDGTIICSAKDLTEVLLDVAGDQHGMQTPAAEWAKADYAPLPALVAAARLIFDHKPLPQIRRAYSAGIPETLAALHRIAEEAKDKNEQHLALVTGVPGAGKTLVGLQFVYANQFNTDDAKKIAVLLSGNGPLVRVLQYVLENRIFVQDVHGYLKQYGGSRHTVPQEHIWVYDEAQRAWDSAKVQELRNHGASEPEDFLRIGVRKNSWCLMVGLIGQGQEIHTGEESGLPQWNDAIRASGRPWTVHCPEALEPLFSAASVVNTVETLNLNVSLRSHLAEDVQTWVSKLLNADLAEARRATGRVWEQGFQLYITRDLERAKEYVRNRYEFEIDKRFGLLASAKARNLSRYGIKNGFLDTRKLKEGPWFNDAPGSSLSCCALEAVATEFQCQGLELDFPIVAWGDDLKWNGKLWQNRPEPNSEAKDPRQLRLNSYRVLLTRGRDGLILFVPAEAGMDSTFSALIDSGMRVLP